MEKKRIAVTGATGFIGRYVINELQKYPVEIFAISRQKSPVFLCQKNLNIVRYDLERFDKSSFEIIGRPDILIHLAWGGLSDYGSLNHFEIELQKNYQFLNNLVKSGLKTIFAAGTCLEYGMQSGCLDENNRVIPCIPYGFAKNALRCQLEFLKNTIPFTFIWGRLFYLYGDGQSEKSLFPQLKKAVAAREKEFNMSSGEQIRDYLHVSDAANYIVRLSLRQQDIGIINICSGKPISIRHLVENWISENNWTIDLNLGCYSFPDYEPLSFWGNSKIIRDFLEK